METLTPAILKMRDTFLSQFTDLTLDNLTLKLKELLEIETDEINRIVILASRVETIRSRILGITSNKLTKPGQSDEVSKENNIVDAIVEDKKEKVSKKSTWVRVIIKENTDVNGVRFPEGIQIDVTEEDSNRLINSGKAELVPEK